MPAPPLPIMFRSWRQPRTSSTVKSSRWNAVIFHALARLARRRARAFTTAATAKATLHTSKPTTNTNRDTAGPPPTWPLPLLALPRPAAYSQIPTNGPHSPGFPTNELALKYENCPVAGTSPERLLKEKSTEVKLCIDWIPAGMPPTRWLRDKLR
uniref:Uncharacterized protein n=1 Tax=Nymphaea colorata TaxID=210225 RepID=A0A5K0VVP6_9MAGN